MRTATPPLSSVDWPDHIEGAGGVQGGWLVWHPPYGHVWWLARPQHNRQHMRVTREGKKGRVKSHKALRKTVRGMERDGPFLRETGGGGGTSSVSCTQHWGTWQRNGGPKPWPDTPAAKRPLRRVTHRDLQAPLLKDPPPPV